MPNLNILKPGQLVVTNRTLTAYRLSDLEDDIDHHTITAQLPKGIPVMVMKHYVFSGSIHTHYSPDQPIFSEVLVFLHDSQFFYIAGNRPPNQKGSSLIGDRVTIPACPMPI